MKKAFTLAEIIIVLIIVGVISALTVPEMIDMYKFKDLTARYQRIYSELTTVFTYAATENNMAESSVEGPTGYYASEFHPAYTMDGINARHRLMEHFHFVRCQQNYGFGSCFADRYYNIRGDTTKTWADFAFTSSFTFSYTTTVKTKWGASILYYVPVDSTVPVVYKVRRKVLDDDGTYRTVVENVIDDELPPSLVAVDTNGPKGPNVIGYDLFTFVVNDDGSLTDVYTADAHNNVHYVSADHCGRVSTRNMTGSKRLNTSQGCVTRVIENGGRVTKF
ncbi:prepilin-type N-terminal cleavage/methylation domain-containing protein [bacterium]|nr:prepilin-type N-terminal cleavage/methylation domain-containing protein [bacterium]